MSVHKRSLKNRLSYGILGLIVVIGILTAVFFAQLSRHINEISEFKGRETALDVINQAVGEQIEHQSGQVYVTICRDEDGNISSIDSNAAAVNELNNKISASVNESLGNLENKEIKVPIGTLSGITFLTGRGVDIPLRLHQIGAAKTKIKSEFEDAGINQTRYRLYLTVTVELTAILPAHSTDISVTYDYMVSETIIVGKIPDMYLAKTD